MWPDVEAAFIGILNDAETLTARAADTIPDNVETLTSGFIRVTRGPGSDDGISDAPLVDVEAFHPERGQAWQIAEQARQVMLAASNSAGVLVDSVRTVSGPVYVHYGPHVARYVASYRATLRRPRT